MLYLTEGDYINAGLSALSIIPGADVFTKTGKANKVLGNGIVESGLKHLDNVTDGIKKLVKKADDAIDLEKHLPKKLLKEEAEAFAKKADKVADDVVEDAAKAIKGGSNTNTPLFLQQALEELDASGLRPGQTELHMSQLNSALDGIQNNYNPTKAYSSVYSDGTNRYLVEGHHTTVAFKMLGKDNAINMNTETSVYWTKKWYQFWRKTIKIVED